MQTCKNTPGGYECPCKAGYLNNTETGECDGKIYGQKEQIRKHLQPNAVLSVPTLHSEDKHIIKMMLPQTYLDAEQALMRTDI